jgi:hypothetical protein
MKELMGKGIMVIDEMVKKFILICPAVNHVIFMGTRHDVTDTCR